MAKPVLHRLRRARPLPDNILLRPMEQPDINKILADYLRHHRRHMRGHGPETYKAGMHRRFVRMARCSNALLACDPSPEALENTRDIMGWLIYMMYEKRALIVHFVYISEAYREQGLCRKLFEAAGWKEGMPIVATHEYRNLDRKKRRQHNVMLNKFILEELHEWPAL